MISMEIEANFVVEEQERESIRYVSKRYKNLWFVLNPPLADQTNAEVPGDDAKSHVYVRMEIHRGGSKS